MPRKARKSIPVPIELPAIVKAWVDAQAEELGLDAATWIRMRLVLMSKEEPALIPFEFATGSIDFATGRRIPDTRSAPPPVEESALDAIVGEKLADAEASGAAEPPPPQDANQVRALRRPLTPYSPTTQPKHLQAL